MSILTAYKSFRQNLSKRICSKFNKKSYISTTNKTALDEPSHLADNVQQQQQKDAHLKSTKENNNIMLQVTAVVDAERASRNDIIINNYNNNNEEINVRKEYENENMCKRQQKSKKGFCISMCKSFNTLKRYVLAKIMRNGNKQDHSKEEYNNNNNKNEIKNNTENVETSSMIIALNNDNNNKNRQIVPVVEECIINDHHSLITDRDNDSIASSEYIEIQEIIYEVYIENEDDSDSNDNDDYAYNSDSAYNIDVDTDDMDTFEDGIEFEFVSNDNNWRNLACAERGMPQNVTSSIQYGSENVVCPLIDQIELDFKKSLEEKLRAEKMAKESQK